MTLDFNEETYGPMRAMAMLDMEPLKRDGRLSARSTRLHKAAMGQLERPAVMTYVVSQTLTSTILFAFI
jgi:hypothetical protein